MVMYCENCGNEIPEGAKFCNKCGARVDLPQTGQPAAASPAGQPSPVTPDQQIPVTPQYTAPDQAYTAPGQTYGAPDQTYTAPGQTYGVPNQTYMSPDQAAYGEGSASGPFAGKDKKPLIIIGVAVVVVILIAAFIITGGFRRTFSSPKSYYTYVEKKAIEEKVNMLGGLYDVALNFLDEYGKKGISTDIDVQVEAMGTELLGSVWNTDLEWLESAKITIDQAKLSSDVRGDEYGLTLNGTKIGTYRSIQDYSKDEKYIRIPEISDAYILQGIYRSSMPALAQIDLKDYFESGSKLSKFIMNYVDVVLDDIEDVSKESATLKVGSTSQKCTLLTVELSCEDLGNMVTDVLKELKDDSDVKDLIMQYAEDMQAINYYLRSPQAVYLEFTENIEKSIDSVEQWLARNRFNKGYTMEVWVNNSDKIIGRSFTSNEDGSEVLHYARPKSGSDFELSLIVGDTSGMFEISGKGTESGSKRSGTYTLRSYDRYNSSSICSLEIEDLQIKDLSKGLLTGTFDIVPGSMFANSRGSASYLSRFNYKLTSKMASKEEKFTLDISNGSENLVTIGVNTSTGSSVTFKVPDSSDNVYDFSNPAHQQAYYRSIDWDKIESILDEVDIPSWYKMNIESEIQSFRYSIQ